MVGCLLRVLVPLVLAFMLGLNAADAAIYTWVDASGTVNLSNLSPPAGAKVTSVTQDSPPPRIAPRADPPVDVANQPEVQALSDRVRQLEYEAEFARRQPPLAPAYPSFPPVQYSQYPADATSLDCDPSWAAGCGGGWPNGPGWWPYGYPAGIFVLQQPNFRRSRPIHGKPNFPVRPPMGKSSVAFRR